MKPNEGNFSDCDTCHVFSISSVSAVCKARELAPTARLQKGTLQIRIEFR